jgi:Xaa-Pro aminopeptidase
LKVVFRQFLIATLGAAPLAAQQPAAPLPPAPDIVEALPGMGRPVDVEATRARRQRLMQGLGDAVILVPAARDRASEYEQDNDFRQDNTFFYLTMLESPRAWLVLHARRGEPGTETLLLPDRDTLAERWTGVKLGPGPEASRLTGVANVISLAKLDSVINAALARDVPVLVTFRDDRVVARIRADSARRAVRNLRPIVDSLRIVKDAAELAALRRAVSISANGHVELMRQAREGMFEYELEGIIEGAFRRQGADRVGYPSIVGCGINGTVLHYDVNRSRCAPGDLVVVDASGEWGQYTADITRTFPVSGTFTPRQRQLYDLVLGAQQAAIDAVRPGITTAELHQIAATYLRERGGSLCGELPCDRYFVHSLSHGLGMDVHDPWRGRRPLEPGMTFTIEPGIYLPSERIGIRIEDDILVTATGYENLSAAAPRTADDIERLMRSARTTAPANTPRRSRP